MLELASDKSELNDIVDKPIQEEALKASKTVVDSEVLDTNTNEEKTLEEASKKFQLSKSDIRADLNCVRCAAFSRSIKNYEKWQKDYISVNKMLSKKSSK